MAENTGFVTRRTQFDPGCGLKNENEMEELEDFTMENIEDCTHGVIVIDPLTQDGETIEIVHFVGYWQEPDKEDLEDLKKELAEDDQFGLVDIADRLEFIPVDGDDLRTFVGMGM